MLKIIPISCQWITIKSIEDKLVIGVNWFTSQSITSLSYEVECISIDSWLNLENILLSDYIRRSSNDDDDDVFTFKGR